MNNEEYALIVAKKIEHLSLEIKKNKNILKVFPNQSFERTKATQQLELLNKELEQLKAMLYTPLVRRIQSLSEVELKTYKDEKIKEINSKISIAKNEISNLEDEVKKINEKLDDIVSHLGNDDSEIEKAKTNVSRLKEAKDDNLLKIERLKNNIWELEKSLGQIQSMQSEQLKANMMRKLQLIDSLGTLDAKNDEKTMMEARPFLQKIQENPQLVEEYYNEYENYNAVSFKKFEEKTEDATIRVLSAPQMNSLDIYIAGESPIVDKHFYSYDAFFSAYEELKKRLKNLENTKQLSQKQHEKLSFLKDLNFEDYNAIYNAIYDAISEILKSTKTEIDVSGKLSKRLYGIESLLDILKDLNKKIIKTRNVKNQIADYEGELKRQIFDALKIILSENHLLSWVEYKGNIALDYKYLAQVFDFDEIKTYITGYFDHFDGNMSRSQDEIDGLKNLISKFEKADSLYKKIEANRAEERDSIRKRIEQKFGVNMDFIVLFLGKNKDREGAIYKEPTSVYLSRVDTLTEIDDALKDQKDKMTVEELERLKSAVENYGKEDPEESTGSKTM